MNSNTIKLKQHFEEILQNEINSNYNEDNIFHAACRYGLEGSGKRIRPLLAYLSYLACGGQDLAECDSAALAVEYIHTYSLMHDDLPSMDNDSERRGRATTHVVFNEAQALVAGDSILTDSFALLSKTDNLSSDQKVAAITCLSQAAGKDGMCLGQGLDLFWTGKENFTMDDLDRIHLNKTGKLISAACKLGAICAGAENEKAKKLESFGLALGLAFQVIDDLIDTYEGTGKTQGKDIEQGKLTYLRLMSAEAAREKANQITETAFQTLSDVGLNNSDLQELGKWLLERRK